MQTLDRPIVIKTSEQRLSAVNAGIFGLAFAASLGFFAKQEWFAGVTDAEWIQLVAAVAIAILFKHFVGLRGDLVPDAISSEVMDSPFQIEVGTLGQIRLTYFDGYQMLFDKAAPGVYALAGDVPRAVHSYFEHLVDIDSRLPVAIKSNSPFLVLSFDKSGQPIATEQLAKAFEWHEDYQEIQRKYAEQAQRRIQ